MQAIFTVLAILFNFAVPQTASDKLWHWQISSAIVSGTDDEDEERLLARMAWFEGGYRRSVASCKIKGDGGKSHGLFQIQPRSKEEAKQACGTLNQQVAIALVYIRRSREMCKHLPPRDQLSMYTTGTCMNNREAQIRWGKE